MDLLKSSKRILVIDDEVDIGEIITGFLEDYYEKIDFINDSALVLEHLSNNKYDMILTDINMPKLDGTKLLSLLRSKGHLTSVIFVSGNVNLNNTLLALRLGVADIIQKPFSQEGLLDTVRNVFELEKRKFELYKKSQTAGLTEINGATKMIGLFQANSAKKKANG